MFHFSGESPEKFSVPLLDLGRCQAIVDVAFHCFFLKMPRKTSKQIAAGQREAAKRGEAPVMPPIDPSVAADSTYVPLREDSESDTETGPSAGAEVPVRLPSQLLCAQIMISTGVSQTQA
jgi:hypothetical protein